MDLQRTLLKDVIMPKLKSVYVIDYYEGVRGLLESRPDFPYKDIFANPRVRTKTEVIWSTDAFSSAPTRLSDLKGEEKEYYSYLLCRELGTLVRLIDILREEEGGAELSSLLAKTISNVDEKSVFCGDNKIVIINWGLIPRQLGFEGASIYRSGKFISGWDKEHSFNPRQPKTPDIPLPEEPTPVPPVTAGETIAQPEPPVPDEGITTNPSGEPEVPPTPGSVGAETSFAFPSKANESEKGENPDNEPEEKKPVLENENPQPSADVAPSEKALPDKNAASEEDVANHGTSKKKDIDYGWKQFFRSFWNGLVFLFRKLWWVLLVLILLLACLLGFRNCQGPFSKINPFFKALPDHPVIMPIENGCVGMSEDGMYKVATDRLNILLEKEDEDTMREWAEAFKKAYPSEDCEIKYYNEATYMLQIKVPSDQRLKIKKELNSKLSDFNFDVFEEAVYQADFTSNDPALNDANASWYLKAIGAAQAWDLTQGSEDIVVAVVDNGFDLSHPELTGRIVSPYNVLTRDSDIRPIVTKNGVDAHGTHVAATAIGNGNNGAGLLGMAPKCKFMPVQVANDNADGSMSNTAVLEGVLYAIEHDADVVNVSLGMYTPEHVKHMSESDQLNYISSSFHQEEAMWETVFEKAKEQDCIIVFAAGNDHVISGVDPKKRNPATVRVSAVDPALSCASFSNYGRFPSLDRYYSTVSAPGVSIYSASPNGQYEYMQGTSMAAPVVSGAIALIRSANPGLHAEEVIEILQNTGREVDPSIGPLINVSDAVNVAMGNDPGQQTVDCESIKTEIKRLQARIDSLSRLCPAAKATPDTLNYDDVVKNPRNLNGTWKSTTTLVNGQDNTPIELYMTFHNMSGELRIVDKGIAFKAPLKAAIVNNEVHITQSESATNSSSDLSFVPYTYECRPDRKRNLFCNASSELNRISFNLIRIK